MQITEGLGPNIHAMVDSELVNVQSAPKVRTPFGSFCLIFRVFTVILLRIQKRSNIRILCNIKSNLIAIDT